MNREGMTLEFVGFQNMDSDLLKKFSEYGPVNILPHRKKNVKAYLSHLKKLLKAKRYDAVHIHGNSATMMMDVMTIRMCGIRRIILHSHNTTCNHIAVHKILRKPMLWVVSDRLACGKDAGRWMYGNKSFVILNNAIDLEKYQFDPEIRRIVRLQLGIKDDVIVVGHAGHFTKQKNHSFLLDVFKDYHDRHPASILMLVSDGPDFEIIKQKANQYGLKDSVLFLGRRSDMQNLYQAMDCFVLPSLWEGLPVVLLEAQASGLPIFASDTITTEVKCTNNIRFISLDKGSKEWSSIIENAMDSAERNDTKVLQQMKEHGFSILEEAEKLRTIYLHS